MLSGRCYSTNNLSLVSSPTNNLLRGGIRHTVIGVSLGLSFWCVGSVAGADLDFLANDVTMQIVCKKVLNSIQSVIP